MHANVAKLIQVLSPPENPKYNRGNWDEVAHEIGTGFPTDFMDFTEAYGAVEICKSLWFHSPFYFVGDGAYQPFAGEREEYRHVLLSRLEEMDAVVGGRAQVPFPDYPKSGGLLPIGANDNGDIVCWITEGEPDEWGTFYWSFPGLSTFTFRELNITGFLLDVLSLNSPLFPSVFHRRNFEPDMRSVD